MQCDELISGTRSAYLNFNHGSSQDFDGDDTNCLLFDALRLTQRRHAAQTPPTVSLGAGGRSCGEWVTVATRLRPTASDSLKANLLLSWVQGFVVGSAEQLTTLISGPTQPELKTLQKRYGTVSGWVFDPPDAEAIKRWVTKYCRENPLDLVSTAASGLIAELFTKER
jgi:hypothetical protein